MAWDRIEIKKSEELPENAWALGYFHSSHEKWDGKTWVRNFHELYIRDMALFALGAVQGERVLDIGCGTGEYMDIMAKMGGVVSGQDISPDCANVALKRLKEKEVNTDIKVGDATKLLFADNYFDAVFSADFFEHITLDQKNKVVSEAYRVLKPGGIFVIKTPNLAYLKISVLIKRVRAILKFKSPLDIYIPHTHNNPDNQHCGLTTHRELEGILLNHMFHAPEITYVYLRRKYIPKAVLSFLYGKKRFSEQIIIEAKKPLFFGFYS